MRRGGGQARVKGRGKAARLIRFHAVDVVNVCVCVSVCLSVCLSVFLCLSVCLYVCVCPGVLNQSMRRVNASLSTPSSPFTASSSAASRKDSTETVNGSKVSTGTSKVSTGTGKNSENSETQVDQTVQSYWQRRMIAAGAELRRSTKAITPELLRSSKGTLNRSTEQSSNAGTEAVNSSRAAELLNIRLNNMSYWQRRMIAAGAALLNRTEVSTGTTNSSAGLLNRRQAVKPVLSYNSSKVGTRFVSGTTLGSTSGFAGALVPAFPLSAESADMLQNEQEKEEQEQEEDEGLSQAKAVKEVAAEREEKERKELKDSEEEEEEARPGNGVAMLDVRKGAEADVGRSPGRGGGGGRGCVCVGGNTERDRACG